jgi:[acyl-carrier-protein] S-malonyltransferase
MTKDAGAFKNRSIAVMFPGQGSQYPGMGVDLAKESPRARAMLERADEILGYSLSDIMAGAHGEELNRTVHTQPAIFVYSMALCEALRDECDFRPVIAAGHSLGEYSALCAAGVIDFEDALEIIRVRAEGMDQAQPVGTSGMAALIGPSASEALRIVETHRGEDVLEAANFNAPDQVVISGHLEAVRRVAEGVKNEKRTKCVMLRVSAAFHTLLMEPAKEALIRSLEPLEPGAFRFSVVANVNAQVYPTSGAAVKELLTEQVVRPVLWEDCVKTMQQSGADCFVEIGPGKVLTGLLRRIDRKAEAVIISDIAGVRAFAEASV